MGQALGTLGGPRSEGLGVNGHGQVVGWSDVDSDPDQIPRRIYAFVFTPGKGMIEVGFGGFSRATGINDAAEVIGTACYPGGGACQAFVYSQANGTTTDVGSLLGFGSSEGVAIDRKHVIVGTSDRGTFT